MTVENIMKLIDRTLVDSVALGVAEIAGTNDAKKRCTKDAQESYARLRAAVEELAKDAARWQMTILVSREVLTHPDARNNPEAVKAYMDSIHQGFTIEVAVDSAIAAMKGQS